MTTSEDYLARQDRYASYGVVETNGLTGPVDFDGFDKTIWTAAALSESGGKFTRIRLLTERGYPNMDVSYIWGVLPDGTPVHVQRFDDYDLGRKTYRSDLQKALIEHGLTKAEINRMGVWDSATYSILY